MTDTPHAERDGSADATRASGQPQRIEPQPKRLVNLSNTLGKRPIPQRTLEPSPPVEAPPTQTSDARPAQPTTTPPADDAETEQPTQRRRSSTPRTRSTSRQTGGAADTGGERTRPTRLRDHTVFYVSVEVSEQVRDLARRESLTNADVIFDAIEATHTDLPSLLESPKVPCCRREAVRPHRTAPRRQEGADLGRHQ